MVRILAFTLCSLILLALLFWAWRHPFSIGWDESDYLNLAHTDYSAFRQHGLRGLARELLTDDSGRPSAYRMLAFPFTLLFGPTINATRLSTITLYALALWFIYAAAKRFASPTREIALVFAASCASVVFASHQFGTEGPLFLATAMLLYSLMKPGDPWWVIGLALGLGMLSKVSFVLIAGPVVIVQLYRRPRTVLMGIALGILIAFPWWAFNYRSAIAYADFTAHAPRHHGMESWIVAFGRLALGWPLAIVTGVALARRRWPWSDLLMPIAGTLPLVLVQLASVNHTMRYLAPAMLTLAFLITALLHDRSATVLAFVGILLLLEVGLVSYPLFSPAHDQHRWNWAQLREQCLSHGYQRPTIAYLGNAWALNPPQMSQPWLQTGDEVTVRWLWRFEEGEIDWPRVLESAAASDVVITLENYQGEIANREDLDNQHDGELATRLATLQRFAPPVRLAIGEATILAFFHIPAAAKSEP